MADYKTVSMSASLSFCLPAQTTTTTALA